MMFNNTEEIRQAFRVVGQEIRSGQTQVEPHRNSYALGLALGVCQAIHCGYDRIAAAEFGVMHGGGLFNLCRAASFLTERFGIKIDVYGFDNAIGLPEPQGYKDHPEIWSKGNFTMADHDALRASLPDFAKLIIGDVGETVPAFKSELFGKRLAFVSIDLDFYSSTKKAMPVFNFDPEYYVPALPIFFDDVFGLLTMNKWCGEEAAIHEFNEEHEFRKIERKEFGMHPHMHICHVLDHPIRTGAIKPVHEFEIWPF